MLFRRFSFHNVPSEPVRVDLYLSPDPNFPEPPVLLNAPVPGGVSVDWELCALAKDEVHHVRVRVKAVGGGLLAERTCSALDPAKDHIIEARATYGGGPSLEVRCYYCDVLSPVTCSARPEPAGTALTH